MGNKHCTACGQSFQPHPRVPTQSYCSAPACQRERRRRWQRNKLRNDPDYQDNQTRAQQAWTQRNPDYWREYRKARPDYAERNRTLQRERNARRNEAVIANMDALAPAAPFPSGIYRLSQVRETGIAKMDVWMVEIILLSRTSEPLPPIAKR